MENDSLDDHSSVDFILANQRAAVGQAITALDANPDEAARSVELSGATGVPAPVINSNLENFERQHKASLTTQLLNNNDYLRSYINANPMAAKVSNDDYAQLDAVSEKVSGMSLPMRVLRAPEALGEMLFPGDPLKHYKEGGRLGSWLQPEDVAQHPMAAAIVAGLGTPIELTLRALTGTIGTGVEAVEHGVGAVLGEKAGKEIAGLTEAEAFGMTGRHGMEMPHGPMERIRPYVENGREPLPTILPEYDDFRAKQNATDVDALKDATSEAQQSLTRERAPEMFRSFIAQHTDAEIAVSGDAAIKLYGDKPPAVDDGVLGWVPGIEDKLALARETGADVHIPLADWLAHAEPEVMQALHDDIRVRPGGITANEVKLTSEAKEAAPEGTKPTEPLPDDVPSYRAATALEPYFSVGDRKLELQRMQQAEGTKFGVAQGFHDFNMVDENGNTIGALNISEQKGGKVLYVDNITGVNGIGPRDLGPALMRDVLRQIKAEFPNAESIAGHRVSGARERAGKEMTMPEAKVRLDRLDEEAFRDILRGGQWETYSPNIQAYIKPDFARTEADRQLVDIVNDELDRIVPKKVAIQGADTIKVDTNRMEGQNAGEDIRVGGAYVRYKETYPIILYALDSNDALGSARHEAIHHLRQYGFFKPEEWNTLEAEALAGGWFNKYKIDRRYPTGGPKLKLEEAVAEAYTDWARGRDKLGERTAETALPPSPLDAIFQRMKDFFDAIKQRIGALLGKDPTWEDIFQKVSTGEVGGREGKPLDARAFDEKLSREPPKDDEPSNVVPHPDQFRQIPWGENDPTQEPIGPRVERTEPIKYEVRKEDGWYNVYAHGDLDNQFGHPQDAQNYVDLHMGRTTGLRPNPGLKANDNLGPETRNLEPPEGGSRVFERAAALGMTVDQFKGLDKAMQEQYAADVAAETKRAEAFQAKTQTKEWKDNRKELRAEVSSEIKQRPDVAADLFFATGELYGKKISSGYKLDSDQLTPEQKAAIPKDYQARGGLNPDDVANMFGYGSGDAMLAKLSEYNAAKLVSGKSARDFVSLVTDHETDRQMRIKYGVLEDNIVDAVKEQVAGETALNMLHEETMALGMRVGAGPLTKDSILTDLRAMYAKMPLGSVSSDAYMRAAGKAGRAAEAARWKGDAQGEFQAKQQQYYATVIANEAIKTEKLLTKFDKLGKQYKRPFDPTKKQSIDPMFSLFNREILSKVGRSYGMTVQGLAEAIGDSAYKGGLADFVKETNKEYKLEGVELPVADWLMPKDFQAKFEDLTVEQFKELNQSVVALDTFGKKVKKWTDQGNKYELDQLIGELNQQVKTKFPAVIDYGAEGKPGLVKRTIAAHMGMETMFARFDGRDPFGLFTKTITYPGARAGNTKDALDREFGEKMSKAPVIPDLGKKLISPLIDPRTGKPVKDFTRGNLMTIIHNMGNDYNWRTFTKGWKIDPDVLRAWVEKNSTPEMFDRAQAVGKVFSNGYERTRNVYSNLYGIAPPSIDIQPFTMHGKTYEGWYHPLIRDDIRSPLKDDTIDGVGYDNFWPSTSNAYIKARTGAVYVVSLSQDMIPIKLNQMLHDIAFREFVHETAKITRNKSFQETISKHYGPEYVEAIDQWLKKVAGNASYDSKTLSMAARLSNKIRQNVIASHIGWSLTTIEKHGPTALMFSAKEVGVKEFARAFAETTPSMFLDATMDLFGKSRDLGDSISKFIENHSEEIKRRTQNFQETVSGVHNIQLGGSTFRQRAIELGSKGVAFSDRISADPTWLAKYREVLDKTGDVGFSTDVANRAVRRAHGSTAVTNAPGIVSNRGVLAPWLSTIYGFWGTRMQRMFELVHDVNDAYHLAKDGEIRQASAMVPQIATSTFVYVIWPAIVEEAVSSQFYDDKKKGGLIEHALRYSLGTIAQSIIGLRDLVYGIENGREPSVGMLSTLLHDPTQLIRDAKKHRPLDKQNAGKFVQDAVTTLGDFTGIGSQHLGSIARYSIDLATHQQKPKGVGDVYRGFVSGKQEKGHN